MKTVFKSDEIAHIWANSGALYGRSPGNLSFNGDALKSYDTVIGRRIRARGKVAYVLDRHGFSITTSPSPIGGMYWGSVAVFPTIGGQYATAQNRREAVRLARKLCRYLNQ